jgi:hypothetical protein
VKSVEKVWLGEVPWESLVDINQALCHAQQVEFTTNAKGLSIAKQCWEVAVKKSMTLAAVLEVCRRCHDASPFMFNNGNTFGSVAKTLIQDWLNSLPPLEAEIVRATVSHYVVGLVGKRELGDVLKHFEPVLRKAAAPKPPQPQAAPVPQPGDSTTTTAPIQRAPASQAV